MAALTAWASFYVITGSSAGALTGLTFIVITLVRESRLQSTNQAALAFNTPMIVHFGEVLFVSAMLSAPWPALLPAGLTLALAGLVGLVYTLIVVGRMRSQEDYKPVLEDWLTHAALPLLAYAVLVVAGLLLANTPVPALFGTGAVMLLLLFIGIHNAWDNATFITLMAPRQRDESKE